MPLSRLLSVTDQFPAAPASSNWVVSGAHTRSGLPLMASDPHLRTQIPGVWFLAEITSDEGQSDGQTNAQRGLHVQGGTLPGAPWVTIGHNDKLAYSATAMMADVQDLFLLRINPDDPN